MKKWMHCFVLSAMVALSAAACGGGGGGGGDASGGADNPGTPGQPPGSGDPGVSAGGPYWVEGALNDTSEGSINGLVATGFPEYAIGPVTWAERDHLYIMPSGSGLAHVKAVADTLPGNFTRFDGEDCYLPVDMNLEPFFSRNIRHAEICFDMERGVALLETEIEASGDVTEEMMNAVFGDIAGRFAYPLGAVQIDRKSPAGADIGAYVVELESRGFQKRYDDGEPEYWKIGADGNTYLFEYDVEGAYVDAEWVVYR